MTLAWGVADLHASWLISWDAEYVEPSRENCGRQQQAVCDDDPPYRVPLNEIVLIREVVKTMLLWKNAESPVVSINIGDGERGNTRDVRNMLEMQGG